MRNQSFGHHRAVPALLTSLALLSGAAAAAPDAPSPQDLITPDVVEAARAIVSDEIVLRSILAQNRQFGTLAQAEIDALDTRWRQEREADDKPLIAATLSNPLSSYLTRIQAKGLGLYAAIFVMDRNGLNVGQSAITGDFWQGDEAKFQKTYPQGATAVFVDEPEWVEEFAVWIAQVNMTIADAQGTPIGAVTFDVNLNELERRMASRTQD